MREILMLENVSPKASAARAVTVEAWPKSGSRCFGLLEYDALEQFMDTLIALGRSPAFNFSGGMYRVVW